MKQIFPLLLLLIFVFPVDRIFAQDSLFTGDTIETQKKLELKGYLKNLEYISFSDGFKNSISNNLIHNRINLKWKPAENFTSAWELRNRLFWGEEVKNNPAFEDLLENPTEALDLSKVWFSSKSAVLHTNLERLWVEYHR